MGVGGDNVRKLETRIFLGRMDMSSYRVELHKVSVERGIEWNDIFQLYCEHKSDQDGFYVSTVGLNGKQAIALIYAIGKKRADSGDRLFCIIRPNTGRSPRHETFNEIAKRFRRTSPEAAEQMWKVSSNVTIIIMFLFAGAIRRTESYMSTCIFSWQMSNGNRRCLLRNGTSYAYILCTFRFGTVRMADR